MDFSLLKLDAEQQTFAEEVNAFLDEHLTEEVHEHERRTGDGFHEGFHLALGERGWIMPMWPVEQGGAGLDPIRKRLFDIAMTRPGVPRITISTTHLVWSAVEKYLDRDLLPDVRQKVASGHVRFCLGYTDPNGGSDIANSTLRAVRDGDEWVLNGSKIFTTGAQNCQYTFLITRTDPELPKHKGLTMFLVPLSTPGVEIQAIHTFGGERTNVVYYGDVRVSDRYRLGEVNAGWSVLHGPLDEEHNMREADGLQEFSGGGLFLHELNRGITTAAQWAHRTPRPGGGTAADDESVQLRLGKIATDLEAARSTPGTFGRVMGAESLVKGAAELIDIVGPEALLSPGAEGAAGDGGLDFAHRYAQGTVTYGGTVEVFRTIIAQHTLGLPQMNFPGRKVYLTGSKR